MESDPERSALGRIARGAAHTLGSTYAGRVVNWVAVVILMKQLTPEDYDHVVLAATIFAFVIAIIGCFQGMEVEGSAESLGQRTTLSVVQALFLVIVIDAFFAMFYLEIDF